MSVVLVVSDDDVLASTVESAAESIRGCRACRVPGLGRLGPHLRNEPIGLVVVHVNPGTDGELLDGLVPQLVGRKPPVAVLLIRDDYDGEQDLWYLRMGVRECLTRPLDLRRLTYLIDSITLRQRFDAVRRGEPSARLEQVYSTASSCMRPLLKRATKLAARNVPILLTGETGAGKTHLAQLMHQFSPRASRPFLAVNCGALPTALIEAELFGHVKGAFTGADEERIGKFGHVEDGTLLLDEIDALPLSAQTKLLRVLDQGVFEPVGANQSLPFKARLIAASNQRLEELIEKDLFRADLYYRLNVIQLYVPALRDRREEIRPLVDWFLQMLAAKHGVPVPGVDARVWKVLEQYDWPGNLRELRNAVEHALTFCEGATIYVEDLPAKFSGLDHSGSRPVTNLERKPLPKSIARQPSNSLARARQEGEYRHLLDVLDECQNNKTQAARALGISRTALYKKLLIFGIS